MCLDSFQFLKFSYLNCSLYLYITDSYSTDFHLSNLLYKCYFQLNIFIFVCFKDMKHHLPSIYGAVMAVIIR